MSIVGVPGEKLSKLIETSAETAAPPMGEPIKQLGEKYNVLQSAFASSERIFQILDEPVDPRPPAQPEDLSRPGHVFPLRGDPGGVLKRAGHTEASIDLCRLAGLTPAEPSDFFGHTCFRRPLLAELT